MTGDERLERLEQELDMILQRETIKDWYSTGELGRQVGKAELTVREHRRTGRLEARKRRSGRGAHPAWVPEPPGVAAPSQGRAHPFSQVGLTAP